mgnify:FL=1
MHTILTTEPSAEYELIDSGGGEKLERYGPVLVSRPDPQALWERRAPERAKGAQAVFGQVPGRRPGWRLAPGLPPRWPVELGGLRFLVKPTSFKHIGLFPEQASNWEWIGERIRGAARPVSVINLFGYTGGATLAAARAGAEVCHVDASKVATAWAHDNARLSGLGEAPIRWIVEDVRSFLKREERRGRRYDGIIMDPPAFGHGPGGELWKIEDDFLKLVSLAFSTLSPNPLFALMNGYASGYSAIAYENNLLPLAERFGGVLESGELTIRESLAGRLLPCGIFARWSAALPPSSDEDSLRG